jgi:hypothetical protein
MDFAEFFFHALWWGRWPVAPSSGRMFGEATMEDGSNG